MNTNKRKLTLICAVHYVKLCYRSLLFLITIVMYVIGRIRQSEELFGGYEDNQWVLGTICWCLPWKWPAASFLPGWKAPDAENSSNGIIVPPARQSQNCSHGNGHWL